MNILHIRTSQFCVFYLTIECKRKEDTEVKASITYLILDSEAKILMR